MVAAGYLFASRTDSYWLMVAAFAIVGAGIAGTSIVPMSVVAAKGFGESRGKAIAVAATGGPLGWTDDSIGHRLPYREGSACGRLSSPWPAAICWRCCQWVLLFIRSRPATEAGQLDHGAAPQPDDLPGLELRAARRTAAFWILASVQLLVSAGLTGTLFNLVPFLIGAGFTPAKAALAESLQAGAVFPGAPIMGTLADRYSGRGVFSVSAIMMAIGSVVVLGARGGAG
jgi:MFS family permease